MAENKGICSPNLAVGLPLCPHWILRSLTLWLPQPQLVEALSARIFCKEQLRQTRLFCYCDQPNRLKGNRSNQLKNKLQEHCSAEEGGLVYYSLPDNEGSSLQLRAVSTLKRLADVSALRGHSCANGVMTSQSRRNSPGQQGICAKQRSPSAHPRLFAPSISTTIMQEPRMAALSQLTVSKSPKLPPARYEDDSHYDAEVRGGGAVQPDVDNGFFSYSNGTQPWFNAIKQW